MMLLVQRTFVSPDEASVEVKGHQASNTSNQCLNNSGWQEVADDVYFGALSEDLSHYL